MANILNLLKNEHIKVKCKMGVENFALEPDGNIYACFSRRDLFLGNIYENDLSMIMDKAPVKKIISSCVRLGCLCLTDF